MQLRKIAVHGSFIPFGNNASTNCNGNISESGSVGIALRCGMLVAIRPNTDSAKEGTPADA